MENSKNFKNMLYMSNSEGLTNSIIGNCIMGSGIALSFISPPLATGVGIVGSGFLVIQTVRSIYSMYVDSKEYKIKEKEQLNLIQLMENLNSNKDISKIAKKFSKCEICESGTLYQMNDSKRVYCDCCNRYDRNLFN